MNAPDYIAPVVGYRVWHWDGARLMSLNGEPWFPSQVLKASCKADFRRAGLPFPVDGHQAPQMGCSCGVYAAKTNDQLSWLTHLGRGICGEVHLWGTVVEHRYGWRAQFAYPKSLTLPPYLIPYDEKESKVVLEALTAYGADLCLKVEATYNAEEVIGVWSKSSGYLKEGLDELTVRATQKITRYLRVAVLAETEERLRCLQGQVKSSRVAEVVQSQVGLPSDEADSIFPHLEQRGTEIVLVNLVSPTAEEAARTFKAMSLSLRNIVVLAIVDQQNPDAIVAAIRASVEDCIDRQNPFGVAESLRFQHWLTITNQRRRGFKQAGGHQLPPGSVPPGGSAPPTASVFAPLWTGPRPMPSRGVYLPWPG